MEVNVPPLIFIIFMFITVFIIGYFSMQWFEAARKFRRQDTTTTDEHRCNCSQPNETSVANLNQGYVYTISGAHMEPPPAFSEVIKDDKDLPKYEEVMEKPHLYRIEKESVVQHV